MSTATDKFLEKCKNFWSEADADGNGNLTVQELAKLIRLVYPGDITDAEIAEMFIDMDEDGDKRMSYEEFSAVFKDKDPKCVQKQELVEVFKSIDKDGSGRLSKEEIKANFCDVIGPISDEDLEGLITKADQDSDGNISCNEFVAAWYSN